MDAKVFPYQYRIGIGIRLHNVDAGIRQIVNMIIVWSVKARRHQIDEVGAIFTKVEFASRY
jgi:hypothetical protein